MNLQVAIGIVRGAQERCTTAREWDAFEVVITAAGKELYRQHLAAGDPN